MKTHSALILLFFFSIEGYTQSWQLINTSNSAIPSNNVTSLATDRNGKIWISTTSGLAGYDGSWKIYGINNDTYYGNKLYNVWYSHDLIWVGTQFYGLWSFDGSNIWQNYQGNSSGNGIKGFGIDNNDTIWILDKFECFSKWCNNQWSEVITFISFPNSLFIDKSGNKWILSGNSGLRKYNNGKIFHYSVSWDTSSVNYIPDPCLYCMVEDSRGNYWIGSDDKGLLKFKGTKWTYFDTTNSKICSNRIRAIAIDNNDILWVGTRDKGISKYDGVSWINYDTNNSPLLSNNINSILIAKDKKIWIAHGYNFLYGGADNGKGIVVLDENGVSVLKNITECNINLFPNPFHDNIYINSDNEIGYAEIEIYNLSGEKLKSIIKHKRGLTMIDLHEYNCGIYIVNIVVGQKKYVYKIVKE